MTIKEMKALFEGCDENENVCIDDANGRAIRIWGGGERSDCGIVLSVLQEFPVEWFDDNGNEVRWIHGKRVELRYEDVEDELEVDCGEFGWKTVNLQLHDGWGAGEGVVIHYPTLDALTEEQMEGLDNALGRRISDSGFIGYDDVAVVLGRLHKYAPPVKRADDLICESIQEVTLVAWPMIYGEDNKLDIDSREVLETIRRWGEEFEAWWINHPEEWICQHDYVAEVGHFAQQKAAEFIKQIEN